MQAMTTPELRTLDDVRRHHDGHWFDADTMRFFASRVSDRLYLPGRFFVSSEKPPHGPRRYTVRFVDVGVSIDTAGDFCELGSSAQAHRLAQRMAGAVAAGRVEVRSDPYPDSSHTSRRSYAWRPFVVLENGDAVPLGTRNTHYRAHALKRWVLESRETGR